jgi:predicted kinase
MTGHQPLAVLVSGAPGSGKSTAGALLARRLGAALLDLDTATSSLTAVVAELHGRRDLDDPELARLTRTARYEAIFALAEANLAIGVSAVLVAPFSLERRDPATWTALERRLEQVGAMTRLVWLRISADEVGRRVGLRGLERDLSKRRGDWPAGLDLDPPLVPHIEVDALLEPAAIAERVLSASGRAAAEEPHGHDA